MQTHAHKEESVKRRTENMVKTKRGLGRKLPPTFKGFDYIFQAPGPQHLFLLFPLSSGATLSKPWLTNELSWPHK